MASDLLLYPVSDVGETFTGIAHREVVYPPSELQIDQAYHPANRLRPVAAKHFLEPPQKRRPLFELGRVIRPHHSAQTAEVAEVESQKAEALASFQVGYAALLIIHFNLQFGELFP
ncbi:hypothetical protein [Bradyrhizobium sp. 33ap4]|uniref:hypothetical protein n=1 Tax=Bradyrhizobium sp. 33ap4 TaxID=3061630 RepID=UPI00292E5F5C|nr:hypothetical protein [Bradyrhizobium sp. 33ap4]